MRFPTSALVCLLFGLAHGAALNEQVLANAHTQIMSNASSLLGWQLAGSQQSLASLDMGCHNITSMGHGRWSTIGLKPALIQQAFCVATIRASNSSALALAQIKLAATDVFITQLLNTFGDEPESSFMWLCQNFDYAAINDQLALDAGRVGRAFCANHAYPTTWVNVVPSDGIVSDPVIYNLASIIFATQYVYSATSAAERWIMCEQYHYMAQSQLQEGINSTIVRTALCVDHDEPLMTSDYPLAIASAMSTGIFRQQLSVAVGAVDDADKQAYLCDNIEHGDLGLLGMTTTNMFC